MSNELVAPRRSGKSLDGKLLSGAMAAWLRAASAFAAVLLIWWAATAAQIYPSVLLPSPVVVWQALVDLTRSGLLADYALNTVINLGVGFVISLVLATAIGIPIGLNRTVAEFLYPLIGFLQSIPGIAWIPLALIWFGFGSSAIIFVIVTGIFFTLIFNVIGGVRQSDPVFQQAALTLGANKYQLLRDVVLPSAMPSFITGIIIGVGNGFRSAVAAEMIGGTGGLGYMISNARTYLHTDQVIGGMIVIGLLWVAIDVIVMTPLQRMTVVRWGTIH